MHSNCSSNVRFYPLDHIRSARTAITFISHFNQNVATGGVIRAERSATLEDIGRTVGSIFNWPHQGIEIRFETLGVFPRLRRPFEPRPFHPAASN